MLNLKLERDRRYELCTLGMLFAARQFECFTLEDRDGGLENGGTKIPGETAIPCGIYKVVISWSNRFKRFLPEILSVPGFSGVRIHPGNTRFDTEGCILVGRARDDSRLYHSRDAFASLFERITKAIDAGEEVTLEVT